MGDSFKPIYISPHLILDALDVGDVDFVRRRTDVFILLCSEQLQPHKVNLQQHFHVQINPVSQLWLRAECWMNALVWCAVLNDLPLSVHVCLGLMWAVRLSCKADPLAWHILLCGERSKEWDRYWRLLHLHRFHHNTPYTKMRNHKLQRKVIKCWKIGCFMSVGIAQVLWHMLMIWELNVYVCV